MARMREKAARSKTQSTTFPSRTAPTTLGTTTKRDKRQIKHSILLSRVQKSSSSSKKPLRRNRKAKPPANLSADLSSLVDALPQAIASAEAGGKLSASANISQAKAVLTGGGGIKSRAGLQKRREAVGRAERERFSRNLAVMAAKDGKQSQQGLENGEAKEAPSVDQGNESRAQRWAALRNHIQQSMAAQGQI